MTSRPALRRGAVLGLASMLLLTSCGLGPEDTGEPAQEGGHYPVTVRNCGTDVTFSAAPDRLVLLKSASVPALHSLGVLDRAVARAGAYPEDYYDEATRAELDGIPELTGTTDASGHLQISQDTVLAQEPHLVMGEVENLPRASLAELGVPVLEEPSLCSTGRPEHPSFEDVYAQLETYGTVFDREDRAEEAAGALRDRVAAAEREAGDGDGRTAAVLYPTVGGGTTYAYGSQSMAEPQLEAAGFANAFADVEDRVFEVTPEELAGRDPDVLILLYSQGDPAAVRRGVEQLPGAQALTALRNDDVLVQPMNLTEPATPLAVDGLERIVERFHR